MMLKMPPLPKTVGGIIAATIAAFAAGTIILGYEPPGLINFNQGDNDGWTLDGFYDGDTKKKTSVTLSGPAYWIDYTDRSSPPEKDPFGDKKGAIIFTGGPGLPGPKQCLSNWWRIDFISKDVSKDPDWQNIKGISANLVDMISMTGLSVIQVQFLLKIKKPDGSTTFLREEDAKGSPVFYPLDKNYLGWWNTLTSKFPVPTGYTVTNIYIRVFGTPFSGSSSWLYKAGYVALDAIDPIK